jgi:hypothetical protein
MGTRQGVLLVKPFFALIHFCVLCCFSRVFLFCLFPSLVDDTHIFSPAHVVTLAFDHFAS